MEENAKFFDRERENIEIFSIFGNESESGKTSKESKKGRDWNVKDFNVCVFSTSYAEVVQVKKLIKRCE